MAFPDAVDWDLVARLALALGLGGLVGLERERHRAQRDVVAGVRTMPLVALAGLLVTLLGQRLGSTFMVPIGMAVFGGFALMLINARMRDGGTGLTTGAALFVTYLVGTMVGLGLQVEAVVVAVATTILLMTRKSLHRVAAVMTEAELSEALTFVVLAFIVLPLAPGEALDPFGAVAPRRVLLIVVLVSALSFVSFVIMRYLGARRGLLVAGLLAGLVSSTAATGSMAAVARGNNRFADLAARAILLASAMMFVRNLSIAVIADPSLQLARAVVVPLAIMGLILFAWGARGVPGVLGHQPPAASHDDGEAAASADAGRRPEAGAAHIELRSPFALRSALRFGVLFLAFSIAAALLQEIPGLGPRAIYLAAFGGLVSTGAVFASMGLLASEGQVDVLVAAQVSILSAMLSLLQKPAIARAVHRPLFKPLAVAAVATTLVGLGAAGAVLWRLP